MSSITGGPVPAYISVGGSKAVAVFRALAGSAFSQRRSLSAVESRTASFSMLFSVKINISRAFFLVKWGNLPFPDVGSLCLYRPGQRMSRATGV